jgi:uncharacterized protein (DUF2141 family)
MKLTRVFALAWFLQSLAVWPQLASENLIRVNIEGLCSDKGQIMCAVYSSAAAFPKDATQALARAQSAVSGRHSVCSFAGIQPGTYAVAVFHDENSNGTLDVNFLGIPREGTGASRNAKGHLGPPKFDDAAFRYAGGRLELKITIKYF